MVGDRIRTIDQRTVTQWADFVQTVRAHPGDQLWVTVDRQGQVLNLPLLPRAVTEQGQTIGRAGIAPVQDAQLVDAYRIRQSLGLGDALGAAVRETYEKSRFTLVMLEQMLIGKASIDNLSGPITIATAAGQTARIGLEAFLRFLAIVSLSLGVINLLPLPLLDGGHLMYYFVEILTGKPVSAERQAIFQRFGVVLLGLLMFIALFNDVQRLFNW